MRHDICRGNVTTIGLFALIKTVMLYTHYTSNNYYPSYLEMITVSQLFDLHVNSHMQRLAS